MKTLYNLYFCGDTTGEVEGMFDEDGNLHHTWCCNDAMWRNEYFNPLMTALGFKVSSKPPEEMVEAMEKKLTDIWGDEENYEEDC